MHDIAAIPRVTSPTTRFMVDEFMRMVEADVFGTTHVELINGRIYRMPAQQDPHLMTIAKATRTLIGVVPVHETLFIQGSVWLDRYTVVDPDFMWVAAPLNTPKHLRPLPILLIEVSDTTYRKDSGLKLRKYAYAGIQDYWIFNLPANRIEVYRDPQNPTGRLRDCRYASVTPFTPGQSIPLLLRPQVTLAVTDLLP